VPAGLGKHEPHDGADQVDATGHRQARLQTVVLADRPDGEGRDHGADAAHVPTETTSVSAHLDKSGCREDE